MNQLSALQSRLLLILKWYHEFCTQNNLRYYLLGGTMLGAARHSGFIPWDDDIDVGMPRRDYEQFLKLTQNKRFGNFTIEDMHTKNKDYCYGYAKIYDVNSTLVENTRYKIKRGIYIDLFPLDGVANEKQEIQPFFRPIYKRYNLLLAKTCAVRPNRKWYKNLAVLLGRAIPNAVLNNKKLMYKIDALCCRRDYDSCRYVGNLYGNWGVREIVEKTVMGQPTLYSFEGLQVYGVANYDRYLTSLYGNWRQLPPKEKQVTHHDFLACDLTHSYLEP